MIKPVAGEVWTDGKTDKVLMHVTHLEGPSGESWRVGWGDGAVFRYWPPEAVKGRKRAEAWPPKGWTKRG